MSYLLKIKFLIITENDLLLQILDEKRVILFSCFLIWKMNNFF